MKLRKTCVAGTFYPDEKEEVLKYINIFNKNFSYEQNIEDIKAIIVPHAGYVFSGYTANIAYNLSSYKKFKTVVVIGPSHRVSFEGASIALYGNYETPLGNIEIDLKKSNELLKKYDYLFFNENAHDEHSTETQAPFIKHYFKESKIIEIIYGKISYSDLSLMYEELLRDDDILLVVSTDLSHFYKKNEAKILDSNCINAINTIDYEKMNLNCEACGKVGVQALLKASKKLKLKSSHLHYCTSYEYTHDDSSVVGYSSHLLGI